MTEKRDHFKFKDGKPVGAVIYSNGGIRTKKRFIEPNKECRVIKNIKTGETATYYDTEDGLMFLKWLNDLSDENEQLKQDNDNLIHLLENQSMIIQELHSELMNCQLKEPIVLTKEDLEVMGKAISYYSHGRCTE